MMKVVRNKKTKLLSNLYMSDYGLFVDITDGEPPTLFEDYVTFDSLIKGCGMALTKVLQDDYELVLIEINGNRIMKIKNEETTPVVGDAWEYTDKSYKYFTKGGIYKIVSIDNVIWVEDNEVMINPNEKPSKFTRESFLLKFKKEISISQYPEPKKEWVPQFMEKVVVWDVPESKKETYLAFITPNGKYVCFCGYSDIENFNQQFASNVRQWENCSKFHEPVTFSQEQAIEIISKHTGTPVDQIVIL